MRSRPTFAVAQALFASIAVFAQGQPRDPARTPGTQSGQDAGRAAFLAANCKNPPAPPAAGRGRGGAPATPQSTQEYTITEIPGVVSGGLRWTLLWEEPGNNADGIVTLDDESVLIARANVRRCRQ